MQTAVSIKVYSRIIDFTWYEKCGNTEVCVVKAGRTYPLWVKMV